MTRNNSFAGNAVLIFIFCVLNFSILCGGNFRVIGPLTLRHVFTLLLLAASFFLRGQYRLPVKFIWLYIIYLFIYLIANLLNGEYSSHSFLQSLYTYHLPSIAIIFGIPSLVRNENDIKCFTYSIVFLYFMNVVLSVLQFTNSDLAWTIATRISSAAEEGMEAAEMYSNTEDSLLGYSIVAGIFGYVVTNGYFLASYLPIFTHRLLCQRNKYRSLSLVLLVVGIIAIFLTQQRMAFIVMILYLLFLMFFSVSKKNRIFLLLFFAVAILFYFNLSSFNLGRISSDVNNDTRIKLFDDFFEFINTKAFWFGGANSFIEQYGKAQHNAFTSAWVLSGVWGFLVFVVFFISLFIESIRIIRQNNNSITTSQFTIGYAVASNLFLIYSLTHSAGVQNGSPMYWTAFMLMYISCRNDNHPTLV